MKAVELDAAWFQAGTVGMARSLPSDSTYDWAGKI
jgi:hypothetical protein